MKLLPAPTANPCAAALGGGEPLLHTSVAVLRPRNRSELRGAPTRRNFRPSDDLYTRATRVLHARLL